MADGMRERLRRSTRGMVEVAPGLYAPADPQVPVGDYTVARWQKTGEGLWKAVPFKEPLMRLDKDMAALLGFPGKQWQTLRRLGRAGFVEIIQAGPHTMLINIDSWFNHLCRCAEDPEFWARENKNLKAYKAAL